MQIINSIVEFNEIRNELTDSIGFVPTMGALHEGHLSLVRNSNLTCKHTIVSIFVNPKQFAPDEDFNNYPRAIKEDIRKLQALNVDIVFIPSQNQIYNEKQTDIVYENYMFEILEGASRPHFFNGVCVVVAKLFDIIKPTHAFFGEKDFQQLRIIEKMTLDLNYNINIIPCKTIRESNGLAMSSRNKYLSLDEKEKSKIIFETLELGVLLINNNQKQLQDIDSQLNNHLKSESIIAIDYLKIINYYSLTEFSNIIDDDYLICIAVYINQTRLIDNISYLSAGSSLI